MLRKIWIVLGAVALITSASNVGPFAGDEHPPADIAHATDEFDKHRQANPATDDMFADGVSYAVGDRPESVAVGDFDQDGWPDLVTANHYSHDVTVLLGHGDGTFAAAVSYAVGDGPHSVAVGDFDQDGWPDLVTADYHSHDVTVLLGHGDGTFAAAVSYALGDGPQSVAVGDFDQDGWPDLVTANPGPDDVTVLLGHGDGTFAAAVSYAVGDGPHSVAVGDFDQDGWPDLVTGNGTTSCGEQLCYFWGDMTTLLGHGDGSFGAGLNFAEGGPRYDVALGDFDQDGWPDLVTPKWDSVHGVTVLLGHGDGTFWPGVSYAPGGPHDSVAVGDFDQDGWLDFVTTNPGSDDVAVLLGHGDGTFWPGVSYAAGDQPESVAVGDFDQDGWPDLVTANRRSDEVFVLINQGGPLPISLDIKPDSFPNSVNPYSRGVIPVAILGSDTFDLADINVTALAFGPNGASIAHLNGHPQDVNYDGIMDLVTHYRTQDTGIACGDESATLTGETLDGRSIEGTDSINTMGCRASRWPAIWMKDQDRPDMQHRDGPVNIERK